MNDREKNIVALAFGNLERTIDSLPGKRVKWDPPLSAGEVARLRRQLVSAPRPRLEVVDAPR